MNNQQNNAIVPDEPGFLARVIQNDAAKKGIAAAFAGILVAAVQEAIWPSR